MPYQKGEGKSVVIALGGNALGNTPQEQLELVKATAKNIVDMVEEGINVVVSHGNGFQVGMINNAFAYASANDGKTPEMPFPGRRHEPGLHRLSAVPGHPERPEASRHQPFYGVRRPRRSWIPRIRRSKPHGWLAPSHREEAKAKAEETAGRSRRTRRGWRQVVASPKPRIVEFDAGKDIMDGGYGRVHGRRRRAGVREGRPVRGRSRGHRHTVLPLSWPPTSAPTCWSS